MTPVSRLTALPAGRKTGVPRMARVGDDIFLVWTEPDGSATKLQAISPGKRWEQSYSPPRCKTFLLTALREVPQALPI